MKRTSKKLALHRDTVKNLAADRVGFANGGASGEFGSACPSVPPNCNEPSGRFGPACASYPPNCVQNNG